MKQIITILLLFILAGQATGIIYSTPTYLQAMQDVDDKNENDTSAKKKEGKEYVAHVLSFQSRLINKVDSNAIPVIIFTSPVVEHHTPPPDAASDH